MIRCFLVKLDEGKYIIEDKTVFWIWVLILKLTINQVITSLHFICPQVVSVQGALILDVSFNFLFNSYTSSFQMKKHIISQHIFILIYAY